MKKHSKLAIAALIMVFVIAFSSVSFASYRLGDVDGNGSIAIRDARLALRASLSIEVLNSEQFKAADLDGNGKISINEARTILRAALKIEVIPDAKPEDPKEPENKKISFGADRGTGDGVFQARSLF